jgi:hypothetical protein
VAIRGDAAQDRRLRGAQNDESIPALTSPRARDR